MAAKKNNGTNKAGSERFVTSASGIIVTKKGGKQSAKRSGGKAEGGK